MNALLTRWSVIFQSLLIFTDGPVYILTYSHMQPCSFSLSILLALALMITKGISIRKCHCFGFGVRQIQQINHEMGIKKKYEANTILLRSNQNLHMYSKYVMRFAHKLCALCILYVFTHNALCPELWNNLLFNHMIDTSFIHPSIKYHSKVLHKVNWVSCLVFIWPHFADCIWFLLLNMFHLRLKGTRRKSKFGPKIDACSHL